MDTHAISIVRPRHKVNFHWAEGESPLELCIRLLSEAGSSDQLESEWSGALDIGAIGEQHVRLRFRTEGSGSADALPRIVHLQVT